MKNLQNKVVWITGASSGIGEYLAYALAMEGAKLVLSARRETELERVAKATGLSENAYLILPLDLTQHGNFEDKTQQVIDHFGRIDVLVNNGGISQRSFFADTDISVFERIIRINFLGAAALTKAVLPHMQRQQSGMFVAVSSVVGKYGSPQRTAYAASKHAVNGFYDSLRAEVWRDNLDVLIVCPGYIKTNISVNALTGDGKPLGSMDKGQMNGLSPEDCARQIIRGIKKKKREIYPGGIKEVGGVYIKRFFPGLFAKVLRKINVR